MKYTYLILLILAIFLLFTGCVTHSSTPQYTTKEITVLNNVQNPWGAFCQCNVLGNDGNVYTSYNNECTKLPKGMNATIKIDNYASHTSQNCQIVNAVIHI